MINGKIIDKAMIFPGIYAIINLKNNKFYIGSSTNVYKRVQYEHKRLLLNKRHPNIHLQRAYNKDSDYFIYVLIEKVNKVNTLLEREQYWLDVLEACENGYNLSPDATGTTGFKMPKEALKKQSARQKKKVVQFAADGEFIKIWDSIKEAQSSLKIKHISSCCKGERQKTAGGFVWVYYDEYLGENFDINNKLPKYKKPGANNPFTKPVVLLSDDNKVIGEWRSAREASDDIDVDYRGISDCARNRRKSYKGKVWRFKHDLINN